MDIEYLFLQLLVTSASFSFVRAIPPQRLAQAGPCVGMDCLHGVLMHGDSGPGDGHGDEDTYNRLQDMDEQNKARVGNLGPCKGRDCLHELMHDGNNKNGDGILHMEQKSIGPQIKPQEGPCEGMDCLHGVLMHADEEPGKLHEMEDEKLRQIEENKEQDGPCIDCAEGRAHKHLPRDTTAPSNDETEHQDKPLAEDPDKFLHIGREAEAHGDSQNVLEVMLEGLGVDTPDELLHEEGFDHNDPKPVLQDNPKPRSGTLDPDSFLHSDADVHDKQPSTILKKVVSGTYDPHEALHGGDAHAHDEEKKNAKQLKDVIEKHEHKDFIRRREQTEEAPDPDDIRGFSLPYISDTLMDDIEQMKAKYLEDLWQEESDILKEWEQEVDKENEDKDNEVEIEDLIDELMEAGLEYAEKIIADIEAEEKGDCKDCESQNAHVHNREAQARADRLAGLTIDDTPSPDDITTKNIKSLSDDENSNTHSDNQKSDSESKQINDIIEAERINEMDNHEHPNPYSSNYRTGRDTAL